MKPYPPYSAQPKIGLITNPHSRRNRARPRAVSAIVANHSNILHRITESPQQIADVLSEFAARGVEVLAINGGDGTTAQVFTVLLEKRPFARLPAIILLPGGTTNVNANDVGLHGKLERAVTRMARWASGQADQAQHLNRPILRIQGATHGQPICGMFFGAGSVIGGIEYCQETFHSRGIGNATGPGLALLRVLWGMFRKDPRFATPSVMRIAVDASADPAPREVLLLVVTSLEHLILGIRPHWGAETGPLHCTWIEAPAPGLIRLFPSVLRGKPGAGATPERGYCSHNTQELRLWLDGTFTLDGDMHEASSAAGPLTVSNGGELEFIRIDERP